MSTVLCDVLRTAVVAAAAGVKSSLHELQHWAVSALRELLCTVHSTCRDIR